MNSTLKIIWVCLIIFCIIGMLISTPYEKPRTQLQKAILRKRLAPIARINAAQKYFEEYENGEFDEVYMFGDSPRFKYLYETELDKKVSEHEHTHNSEPAILKPRYIRDKNNPNILYKYDDYMKYKEESKWNFFGKFIPEAKNQPVKNKPAVYRPLYP